MRYGYCYRCRPKNLQRWSSRELEVQLLQQHPTSSTTRAPLTPTSSWIQYPWRRKQVQKQSKLRRDGNRGVDCVGEEIKGERWEFIGRRSEEMTSSPFTGRELVAALNSRGPDTSLGENWGGNMDWLMLIKVLTGSTNFAVVQSVIGFEKLVCK